MKRARSVFVTEYFETILHALNRGCVTPNDFVEATGLDVYVVRKVLCALVDQGRIRRVAQGQYARMDATATGPIKPTLQSKVLALIQQQPLTSVQIYDKLGLTRSQLTGVINQLISKKQITRIRKGYYAAYLSSGS